MFRRFQWFPSNCVDQFSFKIVGFPARAHHEAVRFDSVLLWPRRAEAIAAPWCRRVKHKTKTNRDGVKSEIDAVNEYLGSPDDKCDTAIEHSMKNAHSNCGASMKDSAEKLAQKSKSLTDKAVDKRKEKESSECSEERGS